MTREELITAAEALAKPTPEAASEYALQGELLAGELNKTMSAREDLPALIGPGNQAMMEDNHRNHVRFMSSLLRDFQPAVLVETVLWVFRAYRAHGFRLTYWPAQLDHWMELLKDRLTPSSFKAIAPIYEFMIVQQPAFTLLSDKALEEAGAPGKPAHGKP